MDENHKKNLMIGGGVTLVVIIIIIIVLVFGYRTRMVRGKFEKMVQSLEIKDKNLIITLISPLTDSKFKNFSQGGYGSLTIKSLNNGKPIKVSMKAETASKIVATPNNSAVKLEGASYAANPSDTLLFYKL